MMLLVMSSMMHKENVKVRKRRTCSSAYQRTTGNRNIRPLKRGKKKLGTTLELLQWKAKNVPQLQDPEFHILEVDFTLSLYPPPPASIFCFSSTLRIVSFGGCRLPDIMVNQLQFPNLQQLTLFDAIISEETLHAMLESCPKLEILLMKRNEGFRYVQINSRSLKSIEELIIEDAPILERLISFERYSRLHISVISAPKLETLGSMVPMHTVKVLSVFPLSLCLDNVLNFIRCFPCLEKLYIQLSCAQGHTNQWPRKHRNLIKSLDLCLKTIVMINYQGTAEQSEFVTFFVENARMLESMRFVVPSCFYHDKNWIRSQNRQLKLDKSSYRGVSFTFTENQFHHNMIHVLRASDLSAADPYHF
ncbi:hypothetical protein SORBI_3001G269501 [Sorghum bicolor]|uniref:Uncharacterized protein n=1 Tax=Sorghum bicolor TaxID=4558 RepID=A0A1Z5S7S3_SORBI|nr:hypothetical protein SORBI_3001G269501 [Sorghum bicolor]